ncbi:MAG: mannosyltransferase [Mycobacteriaceae bacterium]|nr:mannosyltransferase [Mycobacteriaceae bacterium]
MLWAAPALLAAAVLGRVLLGILLPTGLNVVDLHVYVDGSAALLHNRLYDYTYSEQTPDFPLPFTYPPFAALVFFPLHYLVNFVPFKVLALLWQLAVIGGLYALLRLAQRLLGTHRQPRSARIAMLGTAVGMWAEPVRSTLDYGQVNVFLALAGMAAAVAARWWLSGLLVGVVAGIKLTPAVTGFYFLARRNWATVAWSAAVFAGTVGLSYLVVGPEAKTYFGTLLGDASRIGPVGSVQNQSLRGALSRILGHDVQSGPWWIAAVTVTAVLAIFAWRALDSEDRLGQLLIVQLFGLMASPISWTHHWVWLVPLLLWVACSGAWQRRGAAVVAAYWFLDVMIGIPGQLSYFQDSIWPISRPGPLAWAGAVDAVGVLLTYGWLIRTGRRDRAAPAAA